MTINPFDQTSETSEHPFRRFSKKNIHRAFGLVTPGLGGIEVEVMDFVPGGAHLRPLVIINSIEFPMPPSVEFCERMLKNGLRVIFIRRPGFGGTRELPNVLLTRQNIEKGAAIISEAAILSQTLFKLDLANVVLLGLGSANPVCYRLCHLNRVIALSVFATPMFNQDIWSVFQPKWLQAMLRQTVMTKGGFRIAARGLKYYLRRKPNVFFEQFLRKSDGDLAYYNLNQADFSNAAQLMRDIMPETYYYDLSMSLLPDKLLSDRYFEGARAHILSGRETTERWQSQLDAEAKRLGLPVTYAPRGDVFCPYASPDSLLKIISTEQNLSVAS